MEASELFANEMVHDDVELNLPAVEEITLDVVGKEAFRMYKASRIRSSTPAAITTEELGRISYREYCGNKAIATAAGPPPPLDVGTQLENLTASIANMTRAIEGHGRQIGDLTRTVEAVDLRLGAVEGTVNVMNVRLGTVEGTVNAMSVRLGAVEGTVNDMNVRLGAVEGTVNAMNVRLGAVEGTGNVMNVRLAALEETVGVLNGSQNAMNARIAAVEGSMVDLNASMDVANVRLATVDEHVAQLEGQLALLHAFPQNQVVAGIAERMNRLEAHLNRLLAFMDNDAIIRLNRSAFRGQPGEGRLYRLNKITPGYLELPANLRNNLPAVLAGDPPAPGPGVVPPDELVFPQAPGIHLTKQQIGYLAMFYNNSFGINFEENERTAVQMERLKRFLCHDDQ
ncbi:hypothetical protein HDU96_010784 [Phlyctochytrium bullatum]|nr:hypothetical protein HDU96_010784 [Phlyctochytrium bullatum]